MPEIDTLEKFVFFVAGGILYWLGKVFLEWSKEKTEARRKKIDDIASAETTVRLLTESLHDHRNLMLKSGNWTRDTLPPFIKKEN